MKFARLARSAFSTAAELSGRASCSAASRRDSPKNSRDALRASLANFTGDAPRFDDTTILAVRIVDAAY